MLSSMTFETLLQRVPDEAARRYLLTAVRSDLATESNSTNALNGVKNVLMDNPRYLKLYAIAGGLEQLIAKLAASLRAKILLRHRVNAISRSGEDYLVHRGGKRYPFDVVVLALPDYDLRRIEFEDRDLRHAISAHCKFYDRPGHYLRVTALFRTPFWRRKVPGNYFMIDAFGGACVYDESSRFDARRKGRSELAARWAGRENAFQSGRQRSLPHDDSIRCLARSGIRPRESSRTEWSTAGSAELTRFPVGFRKKIYSRGISRSRTATPTFSWSAITCLIPP